MENNREMLHKMIDSITNQGTLDYLATFVKLFLERWGKDYQKEIIPKYKKEETES